MANPLFENSKLTYEPWEAYTDSSHTAILSEKHLTDVLSGFKENERFSIACDRVSNIPCYGHVISGVIVNGEPRLYDGSIGGYITESLDFSKIHNVNIGKTSRKTLSEYGKGAITINGRIE